MVKMRKVNTVQGVDIWEGSGSALKDLGVPNAEELEAKIMLAATLNKIFSSMRLSQAQAAKRLGINQPKISALKNYKLDGFSVARLMDFLTTLNYDIEIVIRKKPRSPRPSISSNTTVLRVRRVDSWRVLLRWYSRQRGHKDPRRGGSIVWHRLRDSGSGT